MTTQNVLSSTSRDAARCVDLPSEMKAQKLCVIYLFFRQWTGTAAMYKADYTVGTDGSLPPDEVTASYGQKRVIDPVHLRVFDTLKKRAETLLADYGLPFCKGVVIPIDKAAEVVDRLRSLADEFNAARDALTATLDEKYREWMNANPKFAGQIAKAAPSAFNVASRINADFAVFGFAPVDPQIDKTDSLERSVEGLFDEVIEDVVKRSRMLHRRSVIGKCADDLSQRTLSTVRTLKTKLEGLRFLNSGVSPIVDLLDRLLSLMPTRGKFTPDQFNALNASLGLLSDTELLRDVAAGKVTLGDYLSAAMPVFNQHQNQPCAPIPDAVGQPRCAQPQQIAPTTSVTTPEMDSVSETQPVSEAPASEAKADASQTPKAIPEEDARPTAQDDALEDLNRMLELCFESGQGNQETVEVHKERTAAVDHVDETPDQPTVDEDIDEDASEFVGEVPPSPSAIHLSAF